MSRSKRMEVLKELREKLPSEPRYGKAIDAKVSDSHAVCETIFKFDV